MPHLANEVLVDAPLDRVYALAKDVESFPEFMPDVESLEVVERSDDGSRTVTKWVGIAKEFRIKIKWTEEDLWDDSTHTCRFKQLKGEYNEYGGIWTFTQTEDGKCKFASELDYEYDIPLIGPLLKKVIERLMRDNTQRLLDAIKTKAEAAQ
jgi:ribosome-associated toxin RatA of RatAB toxin-antitoxin module